MQLECGQGHTGNVWCGCGTLNCKRSDCVIAVGRDRAKRVWDGIGALANEHAWIVGTVPKCARAAVAEMGPSAFRKLGAAVQAEWFASMGYAGTGCVVFVHPVGSVYACEKHPHVRIKCGGEDKTPRCPDCGDKLTGQDDTVWHPHVNVCTPLIDLTDGNVRVIRYKRTQAELAALRALWRSALSEAVGFDVGPAVVHYHFRNGPRRMMHALRYFARSFPGWSGWTNVQGGNRYGKIACRNLKAFREAIEASPTGVMVHPPSVVTCPQCGGVMHMARMTGVTTYHALGPVGVRHAERIHGTAPPGQNWRPSDNMHAEAA
jgi:hypothetical protein